MAQLMPLPLTVSCFSKIQIGFTFLVPAHPGSPGKRAVKRVCHLQADCQELASALEPYARQSCQWQERHSSRKNCNLAILKCFFVMELGIGHSTGLQLTLLLGHQKEHVVCKKFNDEVLVWLSVGSEVQIVCIWSS